MSEKEQVQTLKALREERQETVSRAQELLKEQQAVRKVIRNTLRDGAKTVPEVADSTELPSHVVMWYMMAMKKFNLIEELDMDGQYYRYQLVQEKAS
jgi:predicted transcriptional regulator